MKSKQENYRDLFFDLPNFINNNTENGLPCQSNTIIPSNFIGSDLNKDDQSYNYHSINTFLPLQQQQQQQQSEFYFQYNHNNQATTDIIYEPDYPFGVSGHHLRSDDSVFYNEDNDETAKNEVTTTERILNDMMKMIIEKEQQPIERYTMSMTESFQLYDDFIDDSLWSYQEKQQQQQQHESNSSYSTKGTTTPIMNECFSSNHSTPVLIPDDRSSLNSRSDVENTDICQLSLPEASSSNKRWNCFVGNCTKTYTRRRDLWRHILPNHLGYSLSYECYMCRKGGIRGKRQFTSRRDTAITHIHECWKREFKKKPGNEFKKVPEKVPDENYKIIEANQRFFNCRFVGCSYGTHEKKNFEEHVFTNHDNLNNKRLVDYCDHCHKVLRMTRTQLISAHKQKCQKKHALEG